jgi:hypothetical protein
MNIPAVASEDVLRKSLRECLVARLFSMNFFSEAVIKWIEA